MAISPDKIFTVPVTWNPAVEMGLKEFDVIEARKQYQLPLTYAIFPAQFWPHKNHVRLVEALYLVRNKIPDIDFKIVFTGYRGHSGWPLVKKTIEKYALQEHILCLDHVPVDHLAALYKASLFCVMPSTFEASSYPVIEAQILGCPVMCSNVTSLPELMRDGAGLLFDPFSPVDISEKMIFWINNEQDRVEHAKRALIKARSEHSLENYANGITEVYKKIIKEVS
jgi:glycosyltransferase involved in cell wall biosynthesis